MKTMREVEEDVHAATPMEMAVATGEMMTAAIRRAVEAGDRVALLQAIDVLKGNTEMLERWVREMKQ